MNYAKHVEEMRGILPEECVIFMKPTTSLVPVGEPVRLPRSSGSVHHEVELVVAIGKEGANIARDHALDHVAGAALGLDLTLRDVQRRLKRAGHPWELSKAFEQSAPLGDFTPYPSSYDLANIDLQCQVNDELRQSGNTRDLLFPVVDLIEILSRTWRLRKGDLIFTGTPPGVGPLVPRDRVRVESPQLGSFAWEIV
jgi:2-keto-4-pentenoate hydratase/2-oxohepta-3-ene-1,7-dioic acid hydratase in catechol pathway